MTIRIDPTNGSGMERKASSMRLAAANRYGGADWVVPSSRDINASRDAELAAGPLGGFERIDGDNSNLQVQFDSGEAFVGGSYVASDDNTASEHTVGPLPTNTTTTIYVGFSLSTADTLIIGPAADFGTFDPRTELWQVETGGSGIASDADLRNTSPGGESGDIVADTGFDDDDSTELSLDTGTITNTYPAYDVVIERECTVATENYMDLRVNGISSGDYYFDYYDSYNGQGDSQDGVGSFGRIAGTHKDGGGGTYGSAVAQQTIRVGLPQNIGFDTTDTDPLISTTVEGVGKNLDYIISGNLNAEAAEIDRLELFGGEPSTGRILIRGVDPFR